MSTKISIDWQEAVTGIAYQFRNTDGLMGSAITTGISTHDNVSVANATIPDGAIGHDWTATSVATSEAIRFKRLYSFEPRDDSAAEAVSSPAIDSCRIPLCSGIIAGDTTEFAVSGGDYPADEDWDRIYCFNGDGGNYSVTGTADGEDFIIAITAAASAAWKPGVYEFSGFAKKASQRFKVAGGLVTIQDNPESPYQSHARKVRDNLRALVEGRALINKDIVSSNINGQEITRMQPKDIREWLTFYEVKVKNETVALRGGNIGTYARRIYR